jgi:hypothetical protein
MYYTHGDLMSHAKNAHKNADTTKLFDPFVKIVHSEQYCLTFIKHVLAVIFFRSY